jgi:DsbC/DsbD-like thiol-disulfide interchange protein
MRFVLPSNVIASVVGSVLALMINLSSACAEKPVTLSLVGYIPSVTDSERRIYVGAQFSINEGWHLYWRNPGDSGLPTTVEWKLPMGFSAGPLRWPLPLKFSSDGKPTMVGYEGEVVLISEIIPPPEYRLGDDLSITVKSSWLGCSDRSCFRDRAEITEKISVASSKPRYFFEEWLNRVPSLVSQHPAVRSFRRDSNRNLVLAWRDAVTEVAFLPNHATASGQEKVSVTTNAADNGALETNIGIPSTLLGGKASEKGLVLFRGSNGKRDGVELPLSPTEKEMFDEAVQVLPRAP